jgi:predicted nicotinamide N-methyase
MARESTLDETRRAGDGQGVAHVLGQGLRIQKLPLCPELRLWLLGGDVDLNSKCNELLAAARLPFWAFCWGAGQALARHLLDHPEVVRGKRVVDLGTGCGVAAIAAARAGASHVVAVDSDPRALSMCVANAELNRVRVEVEAALTSQWDVLLATDILYESANLALLERLVTEARTILISDPGRAGTPSPRCAPFKTIEAQTVPDVDYPHRHVHLYELSARQPHDVIAMRLSQHDDACAQ